MIIFGIYVQKNGKPNAKLIICNHQSYLDALIVFSQLKTSFLAKIELSRCCLMKKVGQIIGLIYVDRQHKTNVMDQIIDFLGDEIIVMTQKVLVSADHESIHSPTPDSSIYTHKNTINSSKCKSHQNKYLSLFPEGTTGANDVLMKFKIGTFTLRRLMQPLTIKYISFWPVQATVGVKNIFWIMMNPITIVKMHYLDPVQPYSWESSQQFCSRVNKDMASDLNLAVSKYGLKDFLWFTGKQTEGEVELEKDNFVLLNAYKKICRKNCQNWRYQNQITDII